MTRWQYTPQTPLATSTSGNTYGLYLLVHYSPVFDTSNRRCDCHFSERSYILILFYYPPPVSTGWRVLFLCATHCGSVRPSVRPWTVVPYSLSIRLWARHAKLYGLLQVQTTVFQFRWLCLTLQIFLFIYYFIFIVTYYSFLVSSTSGLFHFCKRWSFIFCVKFLINLSFDGEWC